MAKKRKIKTKGLTQAILKNKWQTAVVVLLAAIILMKLGGESGSQKPTDGSLNQSLEAQPESSAPNETRSLYLTGNDPTLNHEIGAEGPGKTWIASSTDGYGYLITGPFVNIPSGAYKVMFEISADGPLNDSTLVSTIEISSDRSTTIAKKDIFGDEFKKGQFKSFTLNFISGKPLMDVEFKVLHPDNGINITVRKIVLSPGATSWTGSSPALTHEVGNKNPDNSWTSGKHSKDEGYLILGPHISLAPGIYEVSYTFIIDDFPTDDNQHIADIDVTYDGGQTYLPGKLIGLDFTSGNPNHTPMIKSFINRLYVESTLNDVEFRLYYPNSSIKVTLKDINVFIK